MVALAEKGLEYTLKKVHCKRGEPKDPDLCTIFAALSPGGADATVTVPLLQHWSGDELVQVIESAHCAEYINDIWPDRVPLWPADPKQRIAVRQLTEVGGSSGFFLPLTDAEEFPEKLVAHSTKLKLLNMCLEKYSSGGGDLLLGQEMCMAEVLLGPLVIRWHAIGHIIGFDGLKLCEDLGLERAKRWLIAVATRPSVVDTYPFPDPNLFVKLKIRYTVVDDTLVDVSVKVA